MDRTDKIWLYGSVSFSLIASLVCAVVVRQGAVPAEIALARLSIQVCEQINGANTEKTINWMNQVGDYLVASNHEVRNEKVIGDFVIPNYRQALVRCESMNPISPNLFTATAFKLFEADLKLQPSTYFSDMENVYQSIVSHWGKDSQYINWIYPGNSEVLLNCLAERYRGFENDENMRYSTGIAFEAFRLGKLHNDDQIQYTACQILIRQGEYYFAHKQFANALQFYSKAINCVPSAWPEQETQFKDIIKDRIETARKELGLPTAVAQGHRSG